MELIDYIVNITNKYMENLDLEQNYRKYNGEEVIPKSLVVDESIKIATRKIVGLTAYPEYKFFDFINWSESKKAIVIGLNPSKADENLLDQTNQNITNFLHRKNYGGYYLLNILPLVSPIPDDAYNDPNSKNFIGTIVDILNFCLSHDINLDIFLVWGQLDVEINKDFTEVLKKYIKANKLFCTALIEGSNVKYVHANIRGKKADELIKSAVIDVVEKKKYYTIIPATPPLDID